MADENEKPLVDKDYLLEYPQGKVNWIYADTREIPTPKTPYEMFRVRGKIDNYEFSNVYLMPSGRGHSFLYIDSKMREKTRKRAGDMVHITLYEDKTPTAIPEELVMHLTYEESIWEKFELYSDGEQKTFVDWIYSANTEQEKKDRINKTIAMIEKGEKLPEQDTKKE